MPPRPQTAAVLDDASQLHGARVERVIRDAIEAGGGRLAFDRFMELALYAPGLGYYVAGSRKFGADGDFVTAPELSPLFGRTLARQCAQVLAETGGDILEFGAGTGAMALQILTQLTAEGGLPTRYLILEPSPDLRQRQQALLRERLPDDVFTRLHWLDALPPSFTGVMLGNEVLDAMPVHRFRIGADGSEEAFVVASGDGFGWAWGAPAEGLSRAVDALQLPLSDGFVSEVNLRLAPWLTALADVLTRGVVLLIDYGYSRAEYYRPDRNGGTLLCHFRHQAHDNPLVLAGLQDITASVDFTAVAEAGAANGLTLAGFTTQANFLLGCGLDGLLAGSDPDDVAAHTALIQGVKQLTLPTAMGERFKVIGLQRGCDDLPLMGFQLRDLTSRL